MIALEAQVGNMRADYEREKGRLDKSSPVRALLEKSERVRRVIDEVIPALFPLKVRSLGTAMTVFYKQLAHKQQVERIEITDSGATRILSATRSSARTCRQFAKRLKRSMRQVHRAGEKLFIDYAGPTLALMVHGQEVGRANIFVAAMGVSGYCFACATPAQTARDWLGATARALTFYGGVPRLIIPDNPRALVTRADRYEPLLTDSVQDFARHYGCSVLPARAYHPQDKPKVRPVLSQACGKKAWR